MAHHEDWSTPSSSSIPVSNWLISADFKYNYRANGQSKINNKDRGITSLPPFGINGQHEHSDWEVAEVIIYDRELTLEEIQSHESYFSYTYGISFASGVATSAPFIGSTCTICPVGKYKTSTSALCSDCAAGKYSSLVGQTSEDTCKSCSAGKSSSPGQSACFDCPAGKYQEGVTETGTCLTKGCVAGYGNEQFGYARYKASDYDAQKRVWKDSSGNNRDLSTVNGNPTVATSTANANGATSSFSVVKGGTNDGIKMLTNSLSSYTLFHVARLSGGTKGRIFCNWGKFNHNIIKINNHKKLLYSYSYF